MTRPKGCVFKGISLFVLSLALSAVTWAPAAATPQIPAERAPETARPAAESNDTAPTATTETEPETAEATERGIPEVLVQMASPGGETAYAVIVEKSTQRLFLYAYDGDFKKVLETGCSTGKADGPKRKKGDRKTPEGIYFFNDVHEDKELSPIYGVKAFPTDYPNLLDRIAGFTGSAIWLHGTNKPLAPRDSNGCIVLENRDILKLTPYLTLHRTPIIIVDTLAYSDPALNRIAKRAVAGFLREWETALETGPYHAYLSHYASSYLPDIAWWRTWRRYREKYTAEGVSPTVTVRNLSIFHLDDLYVVLFDEFLEMDGDGTAPRRTGTRKLFMTYENDRFAIVGDAYQILPEALAVRRDRPPLLTTLATMEREREADAAVATASPNVTRMVDKWLQAWSDKDIEKYGSFYADDFRSDGRDKSAYLKYKDRLNRIYDYIRVERGDLSIKKGENGHLVASFLQKYRSSGHRTVGTKRLILKEEGGTWKIYREIWHRK